MQTLMMLLGFFITQASAQDLNLDPLRRGSAYTRQSPLPKSRDCGPICSGQSGFKPSNGWRVAGLAFNATKASPNRFVPLVKLFIDDLQVAEVGQLRIKLSISIE